MGKILSLINAAIILPALLNFNCRSQESPGKREPEEFSAMDRRIAESFRKNGKNYSLQSQFIERANFQITNRFNHMAKLSYVIESMNGGLMAEDVFAKQAGSAFRKAGRQALREYFLDKIDIDDYIRGEIGEKIKDSFMGKEEKNIIPTGYDLSEGLPEKINRNILPKNFEWGARIFREKPFAYATFTPGDLSMHARVKREELEFISTLRLVDGWITGAGMRYGWDEKKSLLMDISGCPERFGE